MLVTHERSISLENLCQNRESGGLCQHRQDASGVSTHLQHILVIARMTQGKISLKYRINQ